jgi:uncharacterized protein DUF262/uncharacterized protein DUF1524
MQPSVRTLGAILYSPSQYIIPVFQRNYRWETQQWEKLWDSLLEIGQPNKRGNHFMGFLVFVPGLPQPGHNTAFHLIDGQQRLTTLSLLLAAIRNVARDNTQVDFAEEIHQYYLVHPLKKGEQYYRLLPKERDHDTYIAIVDCKGEPAGRMVDALAYFESQLSAQVGENPAFLRTIFDTVCQRLEFLCATLEKEDAYNIFKSLNSTGVPLSESDLIRNFVFMHVAPDDQDDFDANFWEPLESRFKSSQSALDEERFSKFFRDFLMSDGRYVSPKETFNEFEARYEATDFSPLALASHLLKASAHYEVINGAKADADGEVTAAMRSLNVLDSSTTYPLVLRLFALRDAGTIDAQGLAAAIEMLNGYILRRFICAETSRGYGRTFVRALANDDGKPVATLERYLLTHDWPDDVRFQAAFVSFPLYKRGYAKSIIEAIERARGHKEPADLAEAQIEHVLPQTLNNDWRADLGEDADRIQTEWLHTPGNLTLSGYNLELWNHKFAIKRVRYAQSNVVLTRELSDSNHWAEDEIRSRGQKLALEASKIWKGPALPVSITKSSAADDEQSRFEVRKQFWEGLHDYLQSECPTIPGFEPRPVWTIRLPTSIRHIGIETRLGLQKKVVGIDIWFWREESASLWGEIKLQPQQYNELIGAPWSFEQIKDGPRARMFIEAPVEQVRNPATWPQAQEWFGRNLVAIYEKVFPVLREKMAPPPFTFDEDN